MSMRIPFYFATLIILGSFVDHFLAQWLGSTIYKSLLYGLFVALVFFIIEKTGITEKNISKTAGFGIMALCLLAIPLINVIISE